MGNETAWPFDGLQMFGYDLIAADPPWTFEVRSEKGEGKSAQAQYDCMPTAAIKAMPVNQLAGGDCWLFLWVTAPMLPEGLDVMKAWGFRYKTTVAWQKVTKNGKPAMGPGYIARTLHENILIGAVGNPVREKALPSLFAGVRREHSRKPESFYKLLDGFAPKARRLDLFSRATRKNWTAWGNQSTLFDETAA